MPVHIARLGPRAELQRRGLYDLAWAAAAVPKAADAVIGARSTTAEETEILGFEPGAPVLTITQNHVPAARAGLRTMLPPVAPAETRCLP